MKRVSKNFYVGSFWLVAVIYIISGVLIGMGISAEEIEGIVVLAGLYGGVVGCLLLYKAWASIRDGYARTTPAKAVGFLFIPWFNIYWIFQVVGGFTKDYNSFVERHGITAPHLSKRLFLFSSFFIVVSPYMTAIAIFLIPLGGIIFLVVAFMFVGILVSRICDAINDLSHIDINSLHTGLKPHINKKTPRSNFRSIKCPFCKRKLAYTGERDKPYMCTCGAYGEWLIEGKTVKINRGDESHNLIV